ncbi:MAG: phage tail sheath subtilisin-like domain-containing protein [Acidobacteriota bacterium]|nr:phage tail sheath subtilisin-like domain-containing protein [Acidobacteriota bacterium]
MPEYVAPGVYVDEDRPGPRSIAAASTATAGMAGETERGPVRATLVTSWAGYQLSFGEYVDHPPVGAMHASLPYAVRGFFENGGSRLFVARVVGAGSVAAAASIGGCLVRAASEGTWGNSVLVTMRAATLARRGTPTEEWFRITAAYYREGVAADLVEPTAAALLDDRRRVEPTIFEDFDNLSLAAEDANYAVGTVAAGSQLVRIAQCARGFGAANSRSVPLTGGTTIAAGIDDYAGDSDGDAGGPRGLAGLAAVQEVALLAVPDEGGVAGLRDKIIDTCERMKDRFALLSAHGVLGVATLRAPRDTSYAAFYYPRIRVPAPHTAAGERVVAPVGHIAGIYARVDAARGVLKTPANEVVQGLVAGDHGATRGPVESVVSRIEHDVLNPRGVNVIRDFRAEGHDVRVWGARTMSSDPEWKYISVRRMCIFIEQSIARSLRWVAFEVNDEKTWLAVRTSISDVLRALWREGALIGGTEKEALFVKCDRTTMRQQDLDEGRLVCTIGVAPLKPAEFVILRISWQSAVLAP